MRAPSATAPESCYRTPQWFLARIVSGPFGGLPIQLDPCTTHDNPVKAQRYFTAAENGLAQFWSDDRIFVNPPFVKAEQWARKAIKESQRPHRPRIVFLGPAAVGTAWFHELWKASDDALFVNRRIRFEGVCAAKVLVPGDDGRPKKKACTLGPPAEVHDPQHPEFHAYTEGSPTRGTVLFGLNVILRGMGDLGTNARAA